MKRRIENLAKKAALAERRHCKPSKAMPTVSKEELEAMTFDEKVIRFEGRESLEKFKAGSLPEQVALLREWNKRTHEHIPPEG